MGSSSFVGLENRVVMDPFSISGASAEKSAFQNLGLRAFEVVEDDAKSQLQSACPGVVSCADIVALVARDAVVLTNGPSSLVPLGRRDGRTSSASEASSLPSPADSAAVQRQKFAADHDLVALVGAHTIGKTDWLFFRYRLYNFTTIGNPNGTIDQSFLSQLQSQCPQNGNGSTRVALDKDTESQFDISYYKNVKAGFCFCLIRDA